MSSGTSGRRSLQVVEQVAGLVDRRRPVLPQLVGLPDQIDDLGQFAVLPGPGADPGVRGLGEDVGYPAQLGQDRAAAGFGRVGGEDGTHGEDVDRLRSVRRGRRRRRRRRRRGPASRRRPPVAQAAHAVDLLGDVGQQEVGGEGAYQAAAVSVGAPPAAPDLVGGAAPVGVCRRFLALLGQGADLLDQIEQFRSALADQRSPSSPPTRRTSARSTASAPGGRTSSMTLVSENTDHN